MGGPLCRRTCSATCVKLFERDRLLRGCGRAPSQVILALVWVDIGFTHLVQELNESF